MKHLLTVSLTATILLSAPASAEGPEAAEASPDTTEMAAPSGDAATGEALFAKRCVACHVVVNKAGDKLAGKAARTGPNLFGVTGHGAGAVQDYRYSKDLAAAGADDGLIWSEENFVAFVADPRAFLRDFTGNDRARSKMSFRLKDAQDAADIYAYLRSLNDM